MFCTVAAKPLHLLPRAWIGYPNLSLNWITGNFGQDRAADSAHLAGFLSLTSGTWKMVHICFCLFSLKKVFNIIFPLKHQAGAPKTFSWERQCCLAGAERKFVPISTALNLIRVFVKKSCSPGVLIFWFRCQLTHLHFWICEQFAKIAEVLTVGKLM